MNIELKPGKYVLAVSGGVDSAALLHILCKMPNLDLAVAHFDHGIRTNSSDDRAFVQDISASYALPFYYAEGRLGTAASEAEARKARYEFLNTIKRQTGARAIITAHHQDDILETAIINLLRGTKIKGLSSLKSTDEIIRPLLKFPKSEILAYAKEHKIDWREDTTNLDPKYLRNYVRLNLITKLSRDQKREFLDIIESSAKISGEISEAIKNILPKNDEMNRGGFIQLPHAVACETVAGWLRAKDLNLDKKTVERLTVGLKTVKNGSVLDINKSFQFWIGNGIIKIRQKG